MHFLTRNNRIPLLSFMMTLFPALAVQPHDGSSQQRPDNWMIITAGRDTLHVTTAVTEMEQKTGLMWRKNLKENEGMLFLYEEETMMTFWMKNTFIPLDIAFMNGNGIVTEIQTMHHTNTMTPRTTSRAPSSMALEVGSGWFARHGVEAGDTLTILPFSVYDESP
ncbi:DUF192 domain-containing protein [Prosthecochloris sp. ZM_2]|nr:DUF192 domain-containing protein [Prosthecochloris ethylica]RNA64984.1 DUF192 domain-containing protein [Prosthecochloris sp. ZM_2]